MISPTISFAFANRTHLLSIRPYQSLICICRSWYAFPRPSSLHLFLLLFFFFKILLVHVALVQLFCVSVSTSVNNSSSGGIAVGSYARPLGAMLITFDIAVLVTGEYVTPLPSPLPLSFLPFSGHQAYQTLRFRLRYLVMTKSRLVRHHLPYPPERLLQLPRASSYPDHRGYSNGRNLDHAKWSSIEKLE